MNAALLRPETRRCPVATHGPEETERLGERVGRALLEPAAVRSSAILLLTGPLGAGKTCFVRGLARGLGSTTRVKSPTFALESSHPGRRTLHHLDLYRLAPGPALDELGLEELFAGDDVVAVEWADRLGSRRPERAIAIEFPGDAGNDRTLLFEAPPDLMEMIGGALGTPGGAAG